MKRVLIVIGWFFFVAQVGYPGSRVGHPLTANVVGPFASQEDCTTDRAMVAKEYTAPAFVFVGQCYEVTQ